MNIVGAIIAGLVGTIVMSMLLLMAPKMGMPKMDIVGMLGAMFSKESNTALGWVMHLMNGVIFAILYALLWSAGVGSATWLSGVIFGVVHWLIVGLMFGMVPMMHVGVKAGTVPAPGLYMTANGGMLSFVGGLMGHVVYGLVVALTYSFFAR